MKLCPKVSKFSAQSPSAKMVISIDLDPLSVFTKDKVRS